MAKAVGAVLARHAMAAAAGSVPPFGQFAREVAGEAARVLERRAAKEDRRDRAVVAMVDALMSVPVPAEHRFAALDPAEFAVMLTAAGARRPGPGPESN
jgi:hypothetical protein